MEVKQSWLGITASSGIAPSKKIKGRAWRVGFDTQGVEKPATMVSFKGPMHLWFGSTVAHIIGAKHLGTRGTQYKKGLDGSTGRRVSGGIASKQATLIENKKAGVSSRGVFGTQKKQAAKGVLRTRAGKQALNIPGASTPRAYAHHPGTGGHLPTWEACKSSARTIAVNGYRNEARKALIKSGFGSLTK
jgi:hypothetical protein